MESGARQNQFQSTHSLRSATVLGLLLLPLRDVSIHALLAECDYLGSTKSALIRGFNPRTPCGVRLATSLARGLVRLVSIHALLAECDGPGTPRCLQASCFNPRTPCGVRHVAARGRHFLRSFNPRTPCGVRPQIITIRMWSIKFQSTHSLRSATSLARGLVRLVSSFNPRTPCGVRRDG